MKISKSLHPAIRRNMAHRSCSFLVLVGFFFAAFLFTSDAMAEGKKNVLISHSYDIPADSIVIDKPESFQKVSRGLMLGTLFGLIGLSALVLLLLYNDRQRRRAVVALQKLHDELELRVGDRTRELSRTNEQLRIDIGERLQAEEALRKSQMILNKIFEANPDLLAVIDSNLRVVHSNWHGGYEFVPEEIRDQKPYCYDAYCPGQGKPCNHCHALEVFKTGKPLFTEQYNARIGHVEIRSYPIFDEAGEVILVAEHIRDISARKKMEEEIRKAQKLESLGVLAGGIAHDFNNILTGILGNISLTKMFLSPEDKGFVRLEEAEKASARARDLTQQLLTFSRGGAPVKKMASMQQIVMDSTSFVLSGSNVRCEFAFADDLWAVEVDEGQMSQVINNLIINADQAMPNGGKLGVHAENVVIDPATGLPLKAGRYVEISIIDQGSGITEENQLKIFDPYFTTKEMGSGLGLATVYSILKSHDGHICVESTPGVGTTFRLYLPASDSGLPQESSRNREQSSFIGSGRILVMDDEEVIREIATEILSHLGYRVDVCNDGAEAVELYRNAWEAGEPYTAVIMDLTVPGGMGGREAMKRLLEFDPEVKGIVSSGYSNDPIIAHFREYGFSGVVAKPYKVQDLSETLGSL